jgi:hypothetical protein
MASSIHQSSRGHLKRFESHCLALSHSVKRVSSTRSSLVERTFTANFAFSFMTSPRMLKFQEILQLSKISHIPYSNEMNKTHDKKKVEQSYPRNRPWKPIGLQDVKDSTLSRQSAHKLTARYRLLIAVLTVQFVPHRKHTPSP